MTTIVRRFWRDTTGATAIEYSLIVALVALTIIAGMRGVGTGLSERYAGLSDHLK